MREHLKGMLDAEDACIAALSAVIMEAMPSRLLIFAIFAVGLLFSTIREWSAPDACPRLPVARSSSIMGR
jgi:hypothetical protein